MDFHPKDLPFQKHMISKMKKMQLKQLNDMVKLDFKGKKKDSKF